MKPIKDNTFSRIRAATIPNDNSQPINTMLTDSATRARRSSPLVLPSTFWVLMLRMRTGASAVLKLIRLMQAIRIIRNPILTSRVIVLRLPVWK